MRSSLALAVALTTAVNHRAVPAADYKVSFGVPQVVGSSNFTHSWFPTAELELGEALLQSVSQSADGGVCPPKGHPDWPCAAAYATRNRGTTWRMRPQPFPYPLLPESPANSKRVVASNFSSLHLTCVNASCVGMLTRWRSSTNATFKQLLVLPLAVAGVPADLQQAEDGLLPIMLQDGSILVAMYGYTTNATSRCSSDNPSCYSLFFFSCADPVNSPTNWEYISRIGAVPAMVPKGVSVEGPCEPALCQLPDGRVFVIFRVSSYQEMWGAISNDGGVGWGAVFPTGTWAVSPNLIVMRSGAVVLTAGRPSIGLWVSAFDTTPPTWHFTNVIQQHNARVTVAGHRYPDIEAAVQSVTSPHYSGDINSTTCNAADTCNAGSTRNCADCPHNCTSCVYSCVQYDSTHCSSTTSYTGLALLDDETLMLAYDRLANGFSGPPGRLGDADFVFAMTVKITKTQIGLKAVNQHDGLWLEPDLHPPPTMATAYTLSNATCLNGAPASVAAWLHPTPTTDWVIQIGSASPSLTWCISEEACRQFATPPRHPPTPPPLVALANGGPQSQNCTINPSWCGSNQAVLTQCSMDMLLGDRAFDSNGTTLHFDGRRILVESLHKLSTLGLRGATSVLLTGFSQSGTTVILTADTVGTLLHSIAPKLQRYKALPVDGHHPGFRSLWGEAFGPRFMAGWYGTALNNLARLSGAVGGTPAGCQKQHGRDSASCLWANESLRWVQTPLFAVQQIPAVWDLQCMLDGEPVNNVLQLGCASHNASMLPYTKCVQYPDRCDPEVVRDYIVPLQQLYVNEYMASLQHRPHGGGFYHSCFLGSYFEENFGSTNQSMVPRQVDGVWNQISIDGTTMQAAISEWWAQPTDSASPAEVATRFWADPPWDPDAKPPEVRPPWTGKGDPPVPWWTSRFMRNKSCRGYPWY